MSDFANLPRGHFGCILADPPWRFATFSEKGRGSPKRTSAAVRKLIIAPRREHSRKPDEQYERIEALVAGPYLEMFARAPRQGWDSWGNETDKFAPAIADGRRMAETENTGSGRSPTSSGAEGNRQRHVA